MKKWMTQVLSACMVVLMLGACQTKHREPYFSVQQKANAAKSEAPTSSDYEGAVKILYRFYWGGLGGQIQEKGLLDKELLSKREENPHARFVFNVLVLNGYYAYSGAATTSWEEVETNRNLAATALFDMADNGYVPAAYYIAQTFPAGGSGKRLYQISGLNRQQYYQKIIRYIRVSSEQGFYCGKSVYPLIYGEKYLFNDDEDYKEDFNGQNDYRRIKFKQTSALTAQDGELLERVMAQLDQYSIYDDSTYSIDQLIRFYLDGLDRQPDYAKAYMWSEFGAELFQNHMEKAALSYRQEKIKQYQSLQNELFDKLTPEQIRWAQQEGAHRIQLRVAGKRPDWQPTIYVFEKEPYTR